VRLKVRSLGLLSHPAMFPQLFKHRSGDLEQRFRRLDCFQPALEITFKLIAADRLSVTVTAALGAEVVGVAVRHAAGPAGRQGRVAISALDEASQRKILIEVTSVGQAARDFSSSKAADFAKYGIAVDASGTRRVPAIELIGWMHKLLKWAALMQSAKLLARSLAGKPLMKPLSVPRTPIIDMEAELAEEAVSLDEIRVYVNDESPN